MGAIRCQEVYVHPEEAEVEPNLPLNLLLTIGPPKNAYAYVLLGVPRQVGGNLWSEHKPRRTLRLGDLTGLYGVL